MLIPWELAGSWLLCPNPIPPPVMSWLSAVLKHNLEIVPVNWEITDHTLREHRPQSVPRPSHVYSAEKSSFSMIGWRFWLMHNPYTNLFKSSLKMHTLQLHVYQLSCFKILNSNPFWYFCQVSLALLLQRFIHYRSFQSSFIIINRKIEWYNDTFSYGKYDFFIFMR